MANSNAPTGLWVTRLRNGAPWVGPLRTYYHPATDNAALYVGDPVVLAGSGDARGVPTVTLATAGATNRITGVVVGFLPTSPYMLKYGAASTAFYPIVCDDPAALFVVQEDSAGGALTADNIGENIDLIAAAGNPNTGTSGWMLDSSSAGTGATKQMRIIGLFDAADNAIGTNAKWLCAINLPTETGAAGALGV